MKSYRIKEDGYWFYPQERHWFWDWGWRYMESGFGTNARFGSLADAEAWLNDILTPLPKPKITIHPYYRTPQQ